MSAIPATQMRAFVPFYKVCTPYETTRNPFKVIDFCSRSGNPDLTGDSSREAPFRRKGAGSAPALTSKLRKLGKGGRFLLSSGTDSDNEGIVGTRLTIVLWSLFYARGSAKRVVTPAAILKARVK